MLKKISVPRELSEAPAGVRGAPPSMEKHANEILRGLGHLP
jgi:hypothetical protein